MVGIAFPGTFILDRKGRVTSRFFEDFYVERNTVSSLLVRLGANAAPVSAIFALDDLPEKWQHFTEINASYAVGGKFQPDKFQKRAA